MAKVIITFEDKVKSNGSSVGVKIEFEPEMDPEKMTEAQRWGYEIAKSFNEELQQRNKKPLKRK